MNLQPSREAHDALTAKQITQLGIDKAVDREYVAAITFYNIGGSDLYRRQLTRAERKQVRSLCTLSEYVDLATHYIAATYPAAAECFGIHTTNPHSLYGVAPLTLAWLFHVGTYARMLEAEVSGRNFTPHERRMVGLCNEVSAKGRKLESDPHREP